MKLADIRKFKPCYDPAEIKGAEENKEYTLLEIMRCKDERLTDKDRVWVASKFMEKKQCRIFAIWCARQCKTKVKEIKTYINAIEKYYIFKTATKEEMDAAYRAAYRAAYWSADWLADRAAYSAADWSANCEADEAAYWSAYCEVDWAAYYWSADWSAYWAAESKKQVAKIISILKEAKK